ncbi:glycosyltransferase family 39 protein [Kitasatospora sp. NPDC092948]|uniref:glycosyltransferase family 39 protein n=1 Tax=Kitasatospora sp. NPDC092948 TaxID=3364088 RepID=UPI003827AA98
MAKSAVAENSTGGGNETAAPAGRFSALPSWAVGTLWVWPALITLFLGVRGSWRPQLWRDELASWSAARRSTGELLDMLHHVDAVSGAYYLLLHFWIGRFGDSATSMRLPSALAMAGAAAFVVLIARKQFGSGWTGLVAGLLFAVVPSVSGYAQQVRGYAFVVLFVAAGAWALLRAVERPTWPRWLAYAACVAMAGLFHMISLVFLLPHAIVVALRWRPTRDRRLLFGFPAAVVVAILPLVPLVLLGQRQVGRQISWIHTPHLDTFPGFWAGIFGAPLVGAAFLSMSVLPLAWSGNRRRAVEIGLMAALPIAAVYIVSHGVTSYFMDRYLLFTLPAWCVVAAAGITALRPRMVTALAFVLGTGILGLSTQQHLRVSNSHEYSDQRGAAEAVAAGYRPGDAIVPVRGGLSWMMLDVAMEYYLPERVKPVDVFAAESAIARNDLFVEECDDPAACLGDTERVWMVTYAFDETGDLYEGLPAAQTAALKAKYTPVQVTEVREINVVLLERTF